MPVLSDFPALRIHHSITRADVHEALQSIPYRRIVQEKYYWYIEFWTLAERYATISLSLSLSLSLCLCRDCSYSHRCNRDMANAYLLNRFYGYPPRVFVYVISIALDRAL